MCVARTFGVHATTHLEVLKVPADRYVVSRNATHDASSVFQASARWRILSVPRGVPLSVPGSPGGWERATLKTHCAGAPKRPPTVPAQRRRKNIAPCECRDMSSGDTTSDSSGSRGLRPQEIYSPPAPDGTEGKLTLVDAGCMCLGSHGPTLYIFCSPQRKRNLLQQTNGVESMWSEDRPTPK